MASATLAELRAVTYKPRDSWWTVLLVDPVAVHLVLPAARLRWVTPNRITLSAFALGFVAAGCFLAGTWPWLIAGAIVYHLTFILDCVDGKLARWQRSGSVVGGWLDFTLDQVRLVLCSTALLGGQYLATGRGVYLLLAVVVVFLNMFRYFNGFLMERALFDLATAAGAAPGPMPSIGDDDGPAPTPPPGPSGPAGSSGPSGPVGRLRDWLTRRRIRLNVYSGIEFQMTVLIIAPLTGAVFGVSVAACVLMVAFELAQIARFLRSVNRLRAQAAGATPQAASAAAGVTPGGAAPGAQ